MHEHDILTTRDRCWIEILQKLDDSGVKVKDLEKGDINSHTANQVLRTLESEGMLEREHKMKETFEKTDKFPSL